MKEDILIVDDDREFLAEMKDALQANGYNVETAATGREARESARKRMPAVAILDKRLPDMDGQNLMDEFKKAAACIIITGYGTVNSAVRGFKEGAVDYISKPASPAVVLDVVKKASEKRAKDADCEELKQDNTKLKKFDELKSFFVANVAHEINNPLLMIRESVSQVLDGLTGEVSERARKNLDLAVREIDRLAKFTRNMLDLSKIESGKMPFNKQRFKIKPLIDDVLQEFRSEIDKREVAMAVELDSRLDVMTADEGLVRHVLINLLGNALKYTPAGKRIGLKALQAGDSLRLEVSDEGPGVPKDERERIFDKFYRIFGEQKEGTGLGLPIAKAIVELHDGRIWVESEEGKGSTFVVTLPLA